MSMQDYWRKPVIWAIHPPPKEGGISLGTDKIESGEVTGEKAHRWLGYLQGVLVATGGTSLEEMKMVNLRA